MVSRQNRASETLFQHNQIQFVLVFSSSIILFACFVQSGNGVLSIWDETNQKKIVDLN